MSKDLLGFLRSGRVEEVKAPTRTGGGGPRKQRNPNPALIAVRVWADGSVYPSQAAVTKFDLEYKDAVVKKEDGQKTKYEFPTGQGNGLDLIDTRVWQQFQGGAGLLVAVVPKGSPKVDMFSTVNYDAEGKPKSTAMDQGAQTFGQEVLIPAIEEIYGLEFARSARAAKEGAPAVEAREGLAYVDLEIFEELGEGEEKINITEMFSKDILFVPKRITRGADKGKADYARREKVKVYGFVPVQILRPSAALEVEADDEEAVDLTNASVEERNAVLGG